MDLSFFGFMVVVFAVLGGLAAYHLEGGRRGRPRIWRGVIIGAVIGLLLPVLFGVVHLIFDLALVVLVVLGILAVIRMLL